MGYNPTADALFFRTYHRVFNEYAQTFFGYTSEEVLGKNVRDTIAPAIDSAGRDLHGMLTLIAAHPELHGTNENENICKDGRRGWVYWANRAIRDDKGKVVEILCVGTDITERKRMEAEAQRYQQRLRELAERLAATEEEDRWRISRYIHDTIIQNLSLSSIRLGSIAKPLADAEMKAASDKLLKVRALNDDAIDECRLVTYVNRQVIDTMFMVGIRGYLIKPFTEADLIRHLEFHSGVVGQAVVH